MMAVLERFTGLLRDFIQWWTAGIVALIPRRWHLWSGAVIPLIAVRLRDSSIELLEYSPGSGGDYQVRGELAENIEHDDFIDKLGKCRVVDIQLAEREFLTKDVKLPGATQENLGEALGYEMDRQTPFRAADVYYSFRVLRADAATDRIIVRIHVISRALIKQVVDTLTEVGVRKAQVSCYDDEDILPIQVMLADHTATNQRDQLALLALGGLCVILSIVAVVTPYARVQRSVSELGAEFSALREHALSLNASHKAALHSVKSFNDVVNHRIETPAVAVVFEEIAAALEGFAEVTRLDLVGNKLTIHGKSDNPAVLRSRLDKSPVFADVSFRSTSRPRSGDSQQKFIITLAIDETGGAASDVP